MYLQRHTGRCLLCLSPFWTKVTMGLDLQEDRLAAGLAGHCQPGEKYPGPREIIHLSRILLFHASYCMHAWFYQTLCGERVCHHHGSYLLHNQVYKFKSAQSVVESAPHANLD